MASPPHIFDRRLRRLHLRRAARGDETADFLRARAATDLAERLEAINRHFELALDLGGYGDTFARALGASEAAAKFGLLIRAPAALGARDLPTPTVVADEDRLPFADGTLSLVVSTLALHWVNDLVGALIQIRRALRPDGLFLGALLGGATLTELRQSLMAAEIEIRAGAGPRVSPFVDVADGGALLQRAGFALVVADTDTVRVLYDDPVKLLADLRAMGETSALIERPQTPLTRGVLARALDIYRERHATDDGRFLATFEIITLTGWAPHPDQQKPLRPGSARSRLADALKAREPD